MGDHDGHRKHMLERFHKYGIEPFREHEVLEILLYFSIPRRDTNEIAHKLLKRFHTIEGVLTAPEEELSEFSFISNRTIEHFKLITMLSRIIDKHKEDTKTYLCTTDEIATYFQTQFSMVQDERFAVLSLNNMGRHKAFEFVGYGDIASVGVNIGKIIEIALKTKATEVVICHNHPGGVPFPSQSDIEVTRNVKKALDLIKVVLSDHIIVTRDDYVSLASSEEFKDIFTVQ